MEEPAPRLISHVSHDSAEDGQAHDLIDCAASESIMRRWPRVSKQGAQPLRQDRSSLSEDKADR